MGHKKTTVVNKHHKLPYDVYIGRGSKWGNPFTHLANTKAEHQLETREDAMNAYRDWIGKQTDLLGAIRELQGKTLCCFCKPQACHGDVLSEYANTLTVMDWTDEVFFPQPNEEMGRKIPTLSILYMDAFHELAELEPTFTVLEYQEALEKKGENERYRQWVTDTGIPELKRLMTTTFVGTPAQLAKLSFTTSLMAESLSWSERDKKSIRSTLVNTLSTLNRELLYFESSETSEVEREASA